MPAESRELPRLFDVHDTEWCSLLKERQNSTEALTGRQESYLGAIRRASLLTEPPDRLSLFGVAFDPGFYIPTHHHDIDQFLLVINGEFRMGSRRLRPGHGAFMPAGNPYNVTVGRAGGSFLEFREIPAYRTAFSPQDAHFVGPGAPVEIPGWTKPKGSEKGKTTFFDADAAAIVKCAGFGPGDLNVDAPDSVRNELQYQCLHVPRESGYSMISVATRREFEIPRHRQDADRILYILSGEMTLDAGQVLRSGAGLFLRSGMPTQFRSAAAGVKYLEFRKQSQWRTEWLTWRGESAHVSAQAS